MSSKVWLWALFGFVAIFVLALVGSYNGLVSANVAIDNSWSNVEVDLQRRYDLIPNLVNTVKGYAKHEADVLEEVTRLRSQWGAAKSTDEKVKAANDLEGALSRLMVVVEKYPELKANEGFLRLQDELAGTENRIAVARMRYNEAVQAYNLKVQSFPSNLMAGIFGYKTKDVYFKAKPEAQEAPKVTF
ncbi:MAG TPA: LemA family protein [bacterium]|nr:LemA family protein [bacterium]